MKYLISLLLLVFASASSAGQGAEYVNSYFEQWMKSHDFTAFEKRKDGLHFAKDGVLLSGEIHQVNELRRKELYSVESRVSIRFKDGRQLDDFVAGAGDTAENAFLDSLQNFCLTTLHPIYAELFNHSDPHVRKQSWMIGGAKRRIFLSEWGQRGTKVDESTQKEIEALIEEELRSQKLTRDIHWVKLVALLANGKVEKITLTIDGMTNERLTKRLSEYRWPIPTNFSIAKLFFVVGEV